MLMTLVNGVEMAVRRGGEGTPIVFVHGFPLDHRMWDAQFEVFSLRAQVIVPDLRGFGNSVTADDEVTMPQFADDIAALLPAIEIQEPVVLCGLSMGGYIALEFARRHPDRLRGLILCDTHARGDTPEAAENRLKTAERVLREGPAFLADEMLSKLLAPATIENKPHVVEKIRDMITENHAKGVAAALRGMAKRDKAEEWLDRIECPCRVIVGAEDVITPPEVMRDLADRLPNAGYAEIENAGHMAPMEQPKAVNDVIGAFLDTLK